MLLLLLPVLHLLLLWLPTFFWFSLPLLKLVLRLKVIDAASPAAVAVAVAAAEIAVATATIVIVPLGRHFLHLLLPPLPLQLSHTCPSNLVSPE